MSKGVRQGCILSPHLFSLYTYTETSIRNVEHHDSENSCDEARVNGKLRYLRYADDTALFSTTKEGLTNLLATQEHRESEHLILNIQNTKMMGLVATLFYKEFSVKPISFKNVMPF